MSLLTTTLAVLGAPRVVLAYEARTETETLSLTGGPAQRSSSEAALETAHEHGDPSGERHRGAGETRPFDAVGVTLPSQPDVPVLLRTRQNGQWSGWQELHFDEGERPDADLEPTRPGAHSAVVWVGGADAYEIDAPATVDRVDVHFVRDEVVERTLEVTQPAGAVVKPGIQPRSAWGARAPSQAPSITTDLKMAIVHHSDTPNGYTQAQVPSVIRSIQAYHMDVQGWNDIAYNFVVDSFGRTWEGRAGGISEVVVGGHSAGFNTGSVGVLALGTFTTATPSAAAIESISRVIAWKFAVHRVSPTSRVSYTTAGSTKHPPGTTLNLPRVIGHRDAQSTSCPGAQLYSRLGTIRSKVNSLVSQYQPRHAPPSIHTLDSNADRYTEALHFHTGTRADIWWKPDGHGSMLPVTNNVSGAYKVLTGDFDGDGRDDIIWHGTGTAPDHFWWNRPGGRVSQPVVIDGSFTPVVGDFDGNGVDDVLWYDPGPGPDRVWYFSPGGSRRSVVITQNLITALPHVGDFNGDGRDDVFFYGPGTADDELWLSTGQSFRKVAKTVNDRFTPAVADANGDGIDDIIWFNPGATTIRRWDFRSDGSHLSRGISVDRAYGTPFVGDFDGDGYEDVFLYATGTTRDLVWYSQPTGAVSRQFAVGGDYQVAVGTFDSNASGSPDDILFSTSDGSDYLWVGNADRTFTSRRVG